MLFLASVEYIVKRICKVQLWNRVIKLLPGLDIMKTVGPVKENKQRVQMWSMMATELRGQEDSKKLFQADR